MPVSLLACLPFLAAAPFATVEGFLTIDGAPADQVLDVTLVLVAQDDTQLVEHVATGVEVLGGQFVVTDLDFGGITDEQWQAPIFLTVSAGGVSSPRLPFLRAPMAVAARQAAEGALAGQAPTLGGVAPELFARRTALASGSGLGIPMGNLSGVPAGINDGVDDGPLTSNLGSIRVDGGGVLRIQSGAATAAAIASGAVTSAAFGAGSVGNAVLQNDSVTHAKIAASTLTDGDFAADSLSALAMQGTERSIYEVTAVGCALPVGALSTSSTCDKDTVGCGAGMARECSSNTCLAIEGTGPTCNNTYAGLMLFAP